MKYPILLPNIFNHPFTYESEIDLKLGEFVLVPFAVSYTHLTLPTIYSV